MIKKIFDTTFYYIELVFGIATFLSLLPQMYKIISTKNVDDYSPLFVIGLLIVNIIFFLVGFIENLPGLMLGSFSFIVYNSILIYFSLKNK